jgi:hypothetical protein
MKVGDKVICEIPCDELNAGAIYTIIEYKEDIFGASMVLKEYGVPNKRFNAARFKVVKEDQ